MRLTKSGLYMALGLGLAAAMAPEREAEAVPAFARQTGMACASCHFQNFPALNAFGRGFRASGYTMRGAQDLLESEDMSLPSALNASLVAKLRYNKTNGNTGEGADFGEIQWPDEAALLFGGRASENVGFLVEAGMFGIVGEGEVSATPVDAGGAPVANAEAAGFDHYEVTDLGVETEGNSFLSAKVHFNVANLGGTQLAVIPFSTDGLGAGYGFELLNTGAQRSQRGIENRSGMSAAQALDIGSGSATGIAFVAANSNYFVNVSQWAPVWGGADAELGGLATYARAAWTPTVGGLDVAVGFQNWSGEVTQPHHTAAAPTNITPEGTVIDAQLQGSLGDMTLGLYASHGTVPKETAYNGAAKDAEATAIMAKLGVTNKLTPYLAYRTMDNGAAAANESKAVTVGLQYHPAQNIKLELFHVAESGSAVDARPEKNDSQTMLQLFAGF